MRTHDLLYLSENRYEEPKQLHLDIINEIRKNFPSSENNKVKTILDVGCAAGEFPYQIRKNFPEYKIIAFDLLEVLIDKANKNVSGVEFFVANALEESSVEKNSADVLTCTGLLPIFDDFILPLNNFISWVKPGGKLFIHSLFSEYPFDVRIRYNPSENYGMGVVETGWNIFSKKSISNFLSGLQERGYIIDYSFHEFELQVSLEKQEDLIRSWTFEDSQGHTLVTNGLMILQPHAILEITKS